MYVCYFHLQSHLAAAASGVSPLIVLGAKTVVRETPHRPKVLKTKLELRFSFLHFL